MTTLEEVLDGSRAESQVKSLVWHDIYEGKLTLFHLPSYKFLKLLSTLNPVILTILPESEHRTMVSNATNKLNLNWLNLNLSFANELLPCYPEKIQEIRDMLATVIELLKSGRHLLIHCIGGIHRTGTFSYVLLRSLGNDHETAWGIIKNLREIAIKMIGNHRMEVARELYEIVAGNAELKKMSEMDQRLTSAISVHDYIGSDDMPLLWTRIYLIEPNTFSLQICATNGNLTKYDPGVRIKFRVEELDSEIDKVFSEHRKRENDNEGRVIEIDQAREAVMNYCVSSFPRGSAILAGHDVHLDREIFRKYFGNVMSSLSYRQFELGTVEIVMKREMKNENILEEILNLKKLKTELGF
jgi:oligoribonuclease (3'-5' exoribonuclease)/predicted protein tyrosine phosphatase